MANIRWRPLHEAEQLFEELNLAARTSAELATDVSEDEKNVYVEINVPGIQPDKIDISVHHHHLRVAGSREEEQEFADRDFYHKEIKRGSFERSITLPCEVDEKKARADFEDGVLSIVLPKKAAPEEHKIKVGKRKAK